MSNPIFIVLILLFILLVLFIVPQWRLKRAIHQVIRIFREHNAIGIDNSKTIDELGMRSPGMLERMLRGRDYKQYALRALIKAAIIQTTEDGRLYLSEERLLASGLGGNLSSLHKGTGQ
ncbi:MAG: hypothetical protein HWN70_00725 [Desulfobacterales bacterium]|nr:hypothetical protein [Desulfobacterales bacterium]